MCMTTNVNFNDIVLAIVVSMTKIIILKHWYGSGKKLDYFCFFSVDPIQERYSGAPVSIILIGIFEILCSVRETLIKYEVNFFKNFYYVNNLFSPCSPKYPCAANMNVARTSVHIPSVTNVSVVHNTFTL